jgi:hypothetical protein
MKVFLQSVAFFLALGLSAQSGDKNFWTPSADHDVKPIGKRQIIPIKYLVYQLDLTALKAQLQTAPSEHSVTIEKSNCIIMLPAPNGEMQQFKVIEASVMDPQLQAGFPNIRTYAIRGVTDVYANGKIDYNEFGFHAMIRSANGDYFIDPYATENTSHYITYYTADFVKPEADRLPEVGIEHEHEKKTNGSSVSAVAPCVGNNLKRYRLAIACTGEYAVAATGSATPTMAQTLSRVVTTINRVDGIYQTEVSIRLTLVPTTTNVLFTSASNDPFNGNNNAGTLINESQTVITNTIGSANYDIGHTFSTGGGGLAGLGVVCSNSQKARGITGSPSPVGDPYDVDYVAHEIGHQFRGNHTFNATTSSCSGNRNAATAMEPGSGITIMGYAGICGSTNDLAPNSIAYFHGISYDEIVDFVTTGSGAGCASNSTTANQAPVITGLSNFSIPVSTPFMLTASATDPNGDPLTYSWEEMDAGTAGNWNSGNKPFFRSYVPSTSPTRSFPILSAVLNNSLQTTKGEYLPPTAQTLKFRVTVRDNKMGGGGVCAANNTITTVATAGPFEITYPNATGIVWGMASQQNITWNVNNTNMAPINTASVNILISYNTGNTFTTLVANTPNDGIQTITVPTLPNTVNTCRIKIEAVNNVYYDINQPNFTITGTITAVSEVSKDNALGMSVYPNPFESTFRLAVPALTQEANTEVTIKDVLGKIIKTIMYEKVNLINEEVDLNGFDSGVYFVIVRNNGLQSSARVIKH